jgi:membrane protein YqaA with SNARE-associated domain
MPSCLVDGCAEGGGVNWKPFIEFFVSVGYGILSSLVPIFNSELYIVASQVGGFTEEVTTAVGCAVGQTIGKVGTVLALRGSGHSRLVRRLRERRERPRKPAGRFRTKLRAWSDRLLGLLGGRWSGPPIVFLSACIAIPPLYAVTLAVPATRMSIIPFGAAVLLGRMALFLAIAFGVSALVH